MKQDVVRWYTMTVRDNQPINHPVLPTRKGVNFVTSKKGFANQKGVNLVTQRRMMTS